jgi:hypothetical protein
MVKKSRILYRIRECLCPPSLPVNRPPIDNFLRAPALTPNDIFQVSYPRSGTTWVRNIVAHILYPHDRITTLADLDHLVPDIYRGIPERDHYSSPRVIKTHRPYPYRHEPGNPDLYRKIIYIVRHPFHCIPSFYHLKVHEQGQYLNDTLDDFVNKVVHGAVVHGNWQDHVFSWLVMADEIDILLIRYEDLKQNTSEWIIQIAEFLGKTISVEEADVFTHKCSRDAMVALQSQGSISMKPDYEFIRKHENHPRPNTTLSQEAKSLIWKHNQLAMQQFNYTPDND